MCTLLFKLLPPLLSQTYDLSTYGSIEVERKKRWKYLFSKNVSFPSPPPFRMEKFSPRLVCELKGNPLPLRSGRLNRYIPAAFRLYSKKFHGGGRRIPRDGKKGMKGFEITTTKRSMGGNNPFLYSRRDTPYHPCDSVTVSRH